MTPDPAAVAAAFRALQDRVVGELERIDGTGRFRADPRESETRGLSIPRVLEGGAVIERGAANFTHSRGDRLPAAATTRRPELAGRGFEAVALSVIVHPENPYAPTSHLNIRFFFATREGAEPVWWFGGGFDLTPYYGFREDAVHWHRTARERCRPFGEEVHPRFKEACDRYFHLPHRNESRGIGGIFFDDLSEWGYERTFAFTRGVGEGYLEAYLPILERRKDHPHGERERVFQRVRRGRYVEFNLLHDRGTRYGLQSGRRIEAVLASLPPQAAWSYDFRPEPGSAEARLNEDFLEPRDWLA